MKFPAKLMFFLLAAQMVPCWPGAAQSPPSKKPALIRDTGKADETDEPVVDKPKELNPALAEKNLKIGDFYYKRKNYVAAIARYLDATEYQPNLVEAFEALARAYEKNGDLSKAIEVYKRFIQKNPDSPKIAEFREKLARLEKE